MMTNFREQTIYFLTLDIKVMICSEKYLTS